MEINFWILFVLLVVVFILGWYFGGKSGADEYHKKLCQYFWLYYKKRKSCPLCEVAMGPIPTLWDPSGPKWYPGLAYPFRMFEYGVFLGGEPGHWECIEQGGKAYDLDVDIHELADEQPTNDKDSTPQEAFTRPILEVLSEKRGAPMPEVLVGVQKKMHGQLKSADFKKTSIISMRWEFTAWWQSYELIKNGLMAKPISHHWWEISEEGREHLRSLQK